MNWSGCGEKAVQAKLTIIAENSSSRINTEGHLIEKVSDPAAKTKGDHAEKKQAANRWRETIPERPAGGRKKAHANRQGHQEKGKGVEVPCGNKLTLRQSQAGTRHPAAWTRDTDGRSNRAGNESNSPLRVPEERQIEAEPSDSKQKQPCKV